MGREIKFRAWDKTFNEMNGPEFNDIFINLNGTCRTGTRQGVFELMQYTGFKDKNGVEIYEGDVFNMGDVNIKYVVEWIDTGLKGRQISNRSTVGLEHWKSKISITGNIYQNPELLQP